MKKTHLWNLVLAVALCGGLGGQTLSAAPKKWDVVKDFWWTGQGLDPEALVAWRGMGRETKPNEWSYGTINCTGGTPDNPYPKQIDGICAKAEREPFVQFIPLVETIFNGSIPFFFYIRSDSVGGGTQAEVGYYGKAWYDLAPGFDGAGAGKVLSPNEEYLFMKPVGGGGGGTGIDDIAVAVKWKAPEKGSYRVVGEWLPGGTKTSAEGLNTISFAILSSKGKALVPRKVVEDDGPIEPFDLEAKMEKDEEIIFVVGTDGSPRANQIGLKARIESK